MALDPTNPPSKTGVKPPETSSLPFRWMEDPDVPWAAALKERLAELDPKQPPPVTATQPEHSSPMFSWMAESELRPPAPWRKELELALAERDKAREAAATAPAVPKTRT